MEWRGRLALGVICGLAACTARDVRPPLVAGDIWIRDVTLISPERTEPQPHAHVVIRGDRVDSVGILAPRPAGAGITIIDGTGKYLVPGLIDGHVHLAGVPGLTPEQEASMPEAVAAYDRQLPRSYLYFGFTAVVDLNVTDRARVDRLKAASEGPAIFDCGNALSLANGYPMAFLPAAVRFDAYPNFLYDPRQAATIPSRFASADHSPEAAVARVADGGGACVKAHYEPGFSPRTGKLPVPDAALMSRVREAAHQHRLPLLLHANSLEAHRFAAETRPDVVVHGMWNWGGEDGARGDLPADVRATLDAERMGGVRMMPTSRVIGGLRDLFAPGFLTEPHMRKAVPAQILAWYGTRDGQWFAREIAQDVGAARAPAMLDGVREQGQRAAAYFVRTGGRLLFGSDTPSAPTYANPPGYNGYLELRELESAGLAPRQLLAAASIDNARLFNLAGYGTIEPGKIASLLLLRDDPLKSTSAYDTIETVIVRGRAISRERLSADGN